MTWPATRSPSTKRGAGREHMLTPPSHGPGADGHRVRGDTTDSQLHEKCNSLRGPDVFAGLEAQPRATAAERGTSGFTNLQNPRPPQIGGNRLPLPAVSSSVRRPLLLLVREHLHRTDQAPDCAGRRSSRCVHTLVPTWTETPIRRSSVTRCDRRGVSRWSGPGSRASSGGRPGAALPRIRGPLD